LTVIRDLTGRIAVGGVVGVGVFLVLMGAAIAGLGVMAPPVDEAEEGFGVVSAAPVGLQKSFRAGETFRDCEDCPELVVIPSGVFVMGSPITERERDFEEGPQHEVRVADVFALGKHEVTVGQWQGCLSAAACAPISDRGWSDEQRPVINVSWNAAQEYVRWLSEKTGQKYRLPSEAEWEYAARGGTSSARYWGADIGVDKANCHGCSEIFDGEQTTVVGSFAANPFGLHDMIGNVWEWVGDCWNDSYEGAPADGSAWTKGDCRLGVLRGGSWGYFPRSARAASRHRAEREIGLSTNGFRVLRVIDTEGSSSPP
jgi:formylglycine-generating enzyme required for sulfatase activity